jgi:hypothetical protein
LPHLLAKNIPAYFAGNGVWRQEAVKAAKKRQEKPAEFLEWFVELLTTCGRKISVSPLISLCAKSVILALFLALLFLAQARRFADCPLGDLSQSNNS